MIQRFAILAVLACLMLAGVGVAAAQTAAPTPTPDAEAADSEALPALTQIVVSADGTLAVSLPEGWAGAPTSETADMAIASDLDILPQVGASVPEAGQVMLQISAIERALLTPTGGIFDLALILDQLVSGFEREDGSNPFGNTGTAILNGAPMLSTRAQVDLFDVPAEAYLVVIDRRAESRVLLFIATTPPGELDARKPLLDAIIAETQLRLPQTVYDAPITSVDGALTVQTPETWYGRSVIGSGIVLSPTREGVEIEDLLRLEAGQVVIQISGGARDAVLAEHSRNVRDLASWTLLNYRQPINAVTELTVAEREAARIQFVFGEGEAALELSYLFVDYPEADSIVWFSVVAPPGEASGYDAVVEALVETVEIRATTP